MPAYKFPAKDGKITVDIGVETFAAAKVVKWTSYFKYVVVETEKPLPEEYDKYKL